MWDGGAQTASWILSLHRSPVQRSSLHCCVVVCVWATLGRRAGRRLSDKPDFLFVLLILPRWCLTFVSVQLLWFDDNHVLRASFAHVCTFVGTFSVLSWLLPVCVPEGGGSQRGGTGLCVWVNFLSVHSTVQQWWPTAEPASPDPTSDAYLDTSGRRSSMTWVYQLLIKLFLCVTNRFIFR